MIRKDLPESRVEREGQAVERRETERPEHSLQTEKRHVEQRLRLSMADAVADRRGLSPAERGMLRSDALRTRNRPREGAWQPDQQKVDWHDFRDEERAMGEVTDFLHQEDAFKRENWVKASPLERELALNRLNQTCERAHRVAGPIDVRGKDLAEGGGLIERGNFDPEEWGTEVNRKLLREDDPRAAIEVTLHEFRHSMHETAYQRGLRPPYSDGTDVLPNSAKSEAVRRNLETGYVDPVRADADPTGQSWQHYEGQPSEQDARAYARRVMQEWQSRGFEA